MNSLLRCCFLLVCLYGWMPHSLEASILSAKYLFTDPMIRSVHLSPDGGIISAIYKSEGSDYLVIFDANSRKQIQRFSIGEDSQIKYTEWLSRDYLATTANVNNSTKMVVFRRDNGNHFLPHVISKNGYIVGSDIDSSGFVYYAVEKHSHGKHRYKLVKMSIDDLINNQFNNWIVLSYNRDRFQKYFYDEDNQIILSLIVNPLNNTNQLLRLKKNGLWENILTLKDVDYKFSPVGFTSKNRLIVLTNRETDKVVVQEYDITSEKLGDILYENRKYDIESASVRNRELRSASWFEHGLKTTIYFNRKELKLSSRLRIALGKSEVTIVDRSDDGNRFLVYENSSIEAGLYYIVEGSRAYKFLYSYDHLEPSNMSASTTFSLTTKDGSEIEAYYTPAKNDDKNTLLVMPHGGPIGIRETDRFNPTVQYFASRGFSVLRVNFRGSSGFGKAFQNKGVGQFGKLIEEDISAAVHLLLKQEKFEHICAMGTSYGGYSAVMLAIKHPKLYECVVGAFGIYDLPLLFNSSNLRASPEYRRNIEEVVGSYRAALAERSPVYLAKQLQSPLLLIGGMKDERADIEHSNRMKYVLRKLGKPIETIFYKHAKHGHLYWSGDQHQHSSTFDFLMRSLNLKSTQLEKNDKESKKALAFDYSTIADNFNFGTHVNKHEKQAFDYYLRAMQLNHPRATYNAATMLYYGNGVDVDLSESVRIFQKSAALKYASASMRLGQIYTEGYATPPDLEIAQKYFENAILLKDNAENRLAFAEFLCTAPSTYKQFDRCMTLLETRGSRKSEMEEWKDALRWTLPWIIARGTYDETERTKLNAFISKVYDLNENSFVFTTIDLGFYKRQTDDLPWQIATRAMSGPIMNGSEQSIGVRFQIDFSGFDSASDKTALFAIWEKHFPNGSTRKDESYVLWGSSKSDWTIHRKIKNNDIGSTLHLRIYDLKQQVLFEHSYPIENSDSSTRVN